MPSIMFSKAAHKRSKRAIVGRNGKGRKKWDMNDLLLRIRGHANEDAGGAALEVSTMGHAGSSARCQIYHSISSLILLFFSWALSYDLWSEEGAQESGGGLLISRLEGRSSGVETSEELRL